MLPFVQARERTGRTYPAQVMTNKNEHLQDEAAVPLDPRLEAMIGAKLRSFYDTLASEPVPDRILELLTQLDAKERGRANGSKE